MSETAATYEARAILDRYTSEAQLQQAIVDLCNVLGLQTSHIPDGLYRQAARNKRYDEMTGAGGWPDLVIVGPGGIVFAELKSATGRLSAAQERWRDAIIAAGGAWHLWRPAQWSDGTVEDVLRRLR